MSFKSLSIILHSVKYVASDGVFAGVSRLLQTYSLLAASRVRKGRVGSWLHGAYCEAYEPLRSV